MKMAGGQLKRPAPPMGGEHSVIQHTPALHPSSRPAPDQDCSSPKRKRSDQVTLRQLLFLTAGEDVRRRFIGEHQPRV